MKYLIFSNSGEMDMATLSTFGCSVKVTANPIGLFGTGGKYALAVLMRTKHQVSIYSGLNHHEVTTERGMIRDKEFDFVLVDGKRVGFTTELGKTWAVWMAYRELYCNAKDEPDGLIYSADEIPPAQAGITRIVVAGDEMLKAHEQRGNYILQTTPDSKFGTIEVHQGETKGFFYKGIRVMEFKNPAMFCYNQTASLDLTEDRTAKDQYGVMCSLGRGMMQHASAELLQKVLVASSDSMEHDLDFHWNGYEPSKDFMDTVAALSRDSLVNINKTAFRMWREKSKGPIDLKPIPLTLVQSAMLERATLFCERFGYDVRQYPVVVVESLGDVATLGVADNYGNRILLARRAFESQGTKGIASTLIEEYIHLKFKVADCSREMQTVLFDKMISLAEEIYGEPL